MGKLLTVLGISEELQSRLPKSYLMRETFLEGLQKVYANASDSPRKNQLAYTISSSIRDLLADIKEIETGVPQPKPQSVPVPTPQPTPKQQRNIPTPTPTPTPPQRQPTPQPTPAPTPSKPHQGEKKSEPIKLKSFKLLIEDKDGKIYKKDGNTWIELSRKFIDKFDKELFENIYFKIVWEDNFEIVQSIYNTDEDVIEDLDNTTHFGSFIYKYWDVLTDDKPNKNDYDFTGKPASNIPPTLPSTPQKDKSSNVPTPQPPQSQPTPKKRGRPKKSTESKQPEQKTKGKKDIDDIFDIVIDDIEV